MSIGLKYFFSCVTMIGKGGVTLSDKKTDSITIKVDPEMKSRLNKMIEGTELNLSQQVRIILNLYFKTLDNEKK